MQTDQRFDVLRLVQCQKTCHRGMDSVRGKRLIDLLATEKQVAKEAFFLWSDTLIKQLDQLCRDREEPCYQFLNPYSIIITTSGELFLLDYSSETNHRNLLFINQRKIRSFFLPEGVTYYDRAGPALDLYGLGRTLQYILTYGEIIPALSKREEGKLQKVISSCLRPSSALTYGSFFRIKRQMAGLLKKCQKTSGNSGKRVETPQKKVKPHGKRRKRSSQGERKISFPKRLPKLAKAGLVLVLMLVLGGGLLFVKGSLWGKEVEKEEKKREESLQKEEGKEETQDTGKMQGGDPEVERDMAMAYVLDEGNEELGREYLKMLAERGSVGRDIQAVAEGIRSKKGGKEIEASLNRLDRQIGKDGSRYYRRFLIQGYLQLKNARGYQKVIEIARACQMEETWSEKEMREIKEAMAIAWEELGETEKSAKEYEILIGLTEEEAKKEGLYKKADSLLQQAGKEEEREKLLEKGTAELKTSKELRNLHIRLYCESTERTKEECEALIQKYLQDCPGLREDGEFRKIQEEYGIREEEEKIWIEK